MSSKQSIFGFEIPAFTKPDYFFDLRVEISRAGERSFCIEARHCTKKLACLSVSLDHALKLAADGQCHPYDQIGVVNMIREHLAGNQNCHGILTADRLAAIKVISELAAGFVSCPGPDADAYLNICQMAEQIRVLADALGCTAKRPEEPVVINGQFVMAYGDGG